jgi:hypothetical protein
MATVVPNAGAPPALPSPDDDLASALELQRAHGSLRAWYLRAVAEHTRHHWRTPPTGAQIPFPGAQGGYDFAYDRQHPPTCLEERLVGSGRAAGGLLFSSGMGALCSVFQALGFLLGDDGALIARASYFETLTLLRLGPYAKRWRRARTDEELADALGRFPVDVVFVEPVPYDWALTPVDSSVLGPALDRCPQPPVVVVDTTLTPTGPSLDHLLNELRMRASLLVVVRSGIKLDQAGLELTNLGVVEWWAGRGHRRNEAWAATLAACRVVNGTTLTWAESCALAPAFVLDPVQLSSHAAQVGGNSHRLASRLCQTGELFADCAPTDASWRIPFFVLALRENGREAARALAGLLAGEQRRRGLGWQMSGSFGFRSPRFETILPEEQSRPGEQPQAVLKVAAGAMDGAQLKAIATLLAELVHFDSIDDVRRAWTPIPRVGGAL